MMMMIAASLVASGRWRAVAYVLEGWPGTKHNLGERLSAFAQRLRTRARKAGSDFSRFAQRSTANGAASGGGAPQGLTGLIAMAEARLANAETAIAMLSPSLLLRDVLASELHRAHAKLTQLNRESARLDPDKSAAIVRGLIREFDRIARIAESAAVSTHASGRDETRIPVTLSEAYEVLGLNANASPVAAKKLIDALRLSWHPDHAANAEDLRLREARMKQINAAWAIIQGRREAA
jgi:DnaJ-domain-containing protein 1